MVFNILTKRPPCFETKQTPLHQTSNEIPSTSYNEGMPGLSSNNGDDDMLLDPKRLVFLMYHHFTSYISPSTLQLKHFQRRPGRY